MAIGTITKVWPKGLTKNGKNGPGSVVFTDGTKISTFDDAMLATAMNGVGQVAEYTIETNGQYKNLGSLVLKGAASAQQSAVPAAGKVVDIACGLVGAKIVAALDRNTAALEALGKRIAGIEGLAARTASDPVSTGPAIAIDHLVEAQEKLAKETGPEAAEAMFVAIRRKFTGKDGVLDPEKALAQARKTLAAHGVEV